MPTLTAVVGTAKLVELESTKLIPVDAANCCKAILTMMDNGGTLPKAT